jgi:hypothetical protein
MRLYCSSYHLKRDMLDVWPPFPIQIYSFYLLDDNIIAALEHHDRICEMEFILHPEKLEEWEWTRLQNPFPALTCLRFQFLPQSRPVPVLPVTFLGGSAPSLRSLQLHGIPFPTLPHFLSSCNDLSELYLRNIPNVGYISPEEMVVALSALAKLTCLEIGFCLPEEIRLGHAPPLTRAVLPSLTVLKFHGDRVNEYSEDFLVRIDVPQLEALSIMYEYKCAVFDIQQVITHSLSLGPFHRAEVTFSNLRIGIRLHRSEETYSPKTLELGFDQYAPGYQAECIAQICTLSPLLSSITELDIGSDFSFLWQNDRGDADLRDNSSWPVLFHLFASVQTLHLSRYIWPFVVSFILSSLPGHWGKCQRCIT